jgi:hypothetical protein
VIPLPAWIDPEAWAEFVDMRKRLKKPLTQRSAERQLFRLFELKKAGHDPNAALIQSADHYWQDVYEPKDVKFEPKAKAPVDESKAWAAEYERARIASQTPEAKEAKRRAMEALRSQA